MCVHGWLNCQARESPTSVQINFQDFDTSGFISFSPSYSDPQNLRAQCKSPHLPARSSFAASEFEQMPRHPQLKAERVKGWRETWTYSSWAALFRSRRSRSRHRPVTSDLRSEDASDAAARDPTIRNWPGTRCGPGTRPDLPRKNVRPPPLACAVFSNAFASEQPKFQANLPANSAATCGAESWLAQAP